MRLPSAPRLALCVLAVVVLGTFANPPRVEAAATPDQKFVEAVYLDFLLRGPEAHELAWWSAYLTSGSRTTMVQSLLTDVEFEHLWIVGVRYRYLGEVVAEDPQYEVDLSDLAQSGDFVASEVSVLAGPRYFELNGSTSASFVESIYEDVLLRPSDAQGLDYWVDRLDGATATRATVAQAFIRSVEAANRRVGGPAGATACASTVLTDVEALEAGAFCLVLDRMASGPDGTYWSGQLAATAQLPTFWASLAGSSEYFANAQS